MIAQQTTLYLKKILRLRMASENFLLMMTDLILCALGSHGVNQRERVLFSLVAQPHRALRGLTCPRHATLLPPLVPLLVSRSTAGLVAVRRGPVVAVTCLEAVAIPRLVWGHSRLLQGHRAPSGLRCQRI